MHKFVGSEGSLRGTSAQRQLCHWQDQKLHQEISCHLQVHRAAVAVLGERSHLILADIFWFLVFLLLFAGKMKMIWLEKLKENFMISFCVEF